MRFTEIISEAGSPKQQAAIAIAMKKAGKKPKSVSENDTAAGINKMFNNLGDPVFSNLQRVALLAMQGRQQEASGRLQSVIKDASPAVQKKIIDAVNNIKPVTINGKIADSSTIDKSKSHQDWILNTFIPWVQSLLDQQGVAEGFSLPTMEGIKNWLLKFKQGLGQEADESKEMLDVYARYTQGFPVNDQEMAVANEQLKDVARGIGMGIFAAIPGHVITVPILFGLAKKFNIQLLPSAFNSPNHAVAEGENWSKHNNPRAGGMSKKSVSSYRRSHPGSKIQTAVTTKPSKLKKGSKAAKRRASFCARMRGMKKHRTGAKTAHDPNSNINKSLRRWHCESIEELHQLVMLAEQFIRNNKK